MVDKLSASHSQISYQKHIPTKALSESVKKHAGNLKEDVKVKEKVPALPSADSLLDSKNKMLAMFSAALKEKTLEKIDFMARKKKAKGFSPSLWSTVLKKPRHDRVKAVVRKSGIPTKALVNKNSKMPPFLFSLDAEPKKSNDLAKQSLKCD